MNLRNVNKANTNLKLKDQNLSQYEYTVQREIESVKLYFQISHLLQNHIYDKFMITACCSLTLEY